MAAIRRGQTGPIKPPGVPASVGTASIKTLARDANHIAKKGEKHRGAVLLPLEEAALGHALGGPMYGVRIAVDQAGRC